MTFKYVSIVLAGALALSTPVLAQGNEPVKFSIGSQSLGNALGDLARQANLQLIVDSNLLAGKNAPSLNGEMTPTEALKKLLNKSGLEAQIKGETVIVKKMDHAESSIKAEKIVALESIDVWATQVKSSSLNLGKDVIETKQADHLSDLLRDLPGVDVGGTHSINNRISIRGIEDENLEMTIDGAKISNVNMFHHIGNLLINPDILKKADIQVGANSVVHGGLGGAVTFETKDGAELLQKGQNFGGRIQTNFNSNDSLGGSIALYGRVAKDGDFLIYHNGVNKNNWEDGNGVEIFGVDGKISNTLVKLGYNISDEQRLSLIYDTLKDKGDYAPRPDFGRNYNYARTGYYTFPTNYTRETITLKHELDLGDILVVDTSIYSNQNELERYEKLDGIKAVRPGPVPAGTSTLQGNLYGKVQTKGINVKAQSHVAAGMFENTLTYGILHDTQTSEVTWDSIQYGKNEEAKTFAVYAEDAIDFGNGLVVTPGVRFNNYELDGVLGNFDDNEVTYGLATEYAINDNFSLLASATTLYKGVEMVDVLSSTRVSTTLVNQNLKAETGINKEIGFKYNSANILGGDSIVFSFTYFNTDIDDYIYYTTTSATNMGRLAIRGYESSLGYTKGDLNTLVTYSHSDSNFEQTGYSTQREPGDSISINLDYTITSEVSFSWDSLIVRDEDKLYDAAQNPKKGYDVHDIAIKWKPQFAKGLSVIGGIDNIFNEVYTSHASENRFFNVTAGQSVLGVATTGATSADYEPGRNYKVTLAYQF